jgi:hypothetical protein
MMLMDEAVQAAKAFFHDHPDELRRALRNALGLRLHVPLAALRWMAARAEATGKVQNVAITARPPGLSVGLDVEAMGTPVRATLDLYVERMVCSESELTVAVRLENVVLKVLKDVPTPVAALIKSGALDLSKPGDLVAHLPHRPAVLAEAEGSRIVVDLLKDPQLAASARVRQLVSLATALVTVHGVEAGREHLEIEFRAFPSGIATAARAVQQHLVRPALARYLPAAR